MLCGLGNACISFPGFLDNATWARFKLSGLGLPGVTRQIIGDALRFEKRRLLRLHSSSLL